MGPCGAMPAAAGGGLQRQRASGVMGVHASTEAAAAVPVWRRLPAGKGAVVTRPLCRGRQVWAFDITTPHRNYGAGTRPGEGGKEAWGFAPTRPATVPGGWRDGCERA